MNLLHFKIKLFIPQVDFSVRESYRDLVQQGRSHFGNKPVSVLVNNVATQADNGTPVHLLDEELWRKVLAVNLESYFLMSKQALLGGMLDAGKGVIINIASVQGLQSQVDTALNYNKLRHSHRLLGSLSRH